MALNLVSWLASCFPPGAGRLRRELEAGEPVCIDPIFSQAQQQAPSRQHLQLRYVPLAEMLQSLLDLWKVRVNVVRGSWCKL